MVFCACHWFGNQRTARVSHGLLARYIRLWVAHAPGMPRMFPCNRGLVIPTCTTHLRDACRDRSLTVSFEGGGGENVPGIHGACATRNFTYPLSRDGSPGVLQKILFGSSQNGHALAQPKERDMGHISLNSRVSKGLLLRAIKCRINILRLVESGRHFTDDISKYISFNENMNFD